MTGGVGFRITELWAYLMLHGDGDEGIPAFLAPGNVMMPMVCADLERLQKVRPMAEIAARKAGKQVAIARFTQRTDAGIILP